MSEGITLSEVTWNFGSRMARSRRPLVVVASGAFSSVCACRAVSQFPKRTPLEATPLTRTIPLASSGARSPLSAASTASLRAAWSRKDAGELARLSLRLTKQEARKAAARLAVAQPLAGRDLIAGSYL